jgi:hypothetical protein
MNKAEFWNTIETAKAASNSEMAFLGAIETELSKLKPPALLLWQTEFEARMHESYLAALWDASELINRDNSEEGFEHFRAWLVAKGQNIFETALHRYDSIAELGAKRGSAKLEDFLFVAGGVYADKTGETNFYDQIERKDATLEGVRASGKAELAASLPALVKAYG